MTDRMAALERVAEAARKWQASVLTVFPRSDDEQMAYEEFDNAIAALDALPAEPVGETVEVAMWENPSGRVLLARVGTPADDQYQFGMQWDRVAVARVPLPTIPTVAARVEG